MKPDRRILLNLLLALCLVWPAFGQAAEIRVAVAANFTETAKTLGNAFERRTGHRVTHSFGSSGQLATQIHQGAPFDVFLSADAERPVWLEQQNLTVRGSRFTYAYGRLVLWSGDKSRTDVNLRGLRAGRFNRLAIADPLTAPYGVAAEEVLKKHALFGQISPKIVKGGNIAQTYGFVKTRAADMGFVALSQVKGRNEGIYWLVPATDYSPIDQQAVWLKRSENNTAARAYMGFLKSPEARKIIRAQGYEVD